MRKSRPKRDIWDFLASHFRSHLVEKPSAGKSPVAFGGPLSEAKCLTRFFQRQPTEKPQPHLVDKRGGLQGVTRCFVVHLLRGEFAEFVIDKRKQFLRGFGIALLD